MWSMEFLNLWNCFSLLLSNPMIHLLNSFLSISSVSLSSYSNAEVLCPFRGVMLSSLFFSFQVSAFIFRHLWNYLLLFSCDGFCIWTMSLWLSGVSALLVNTQKHVLGVVRELWSVLQGRASIQDKVVYGRSSLVSRKEDMITSVDIITPSSPLFQGV